MTDETRQPTTEQQESKPIEVDVVLSVFMNELAGIAWIKLGLQPDPMTRQLTKDIGQAKRAVDACAALAAILEPQLDAEDKRQVQNLVRDLKMNYVEKANQP